MPIANTLSDVWCRFQEELLPALTEFPGPLSERNQKFVAALEFATPQALLPAEPWHAGRFRRLWSVVHGEGSLESADHAGFD